MTKTMNALLAMGLCAAALSGCETSGGGYGTPYARGINEGPVRAGSGAVVVVDRDGRDDRYDDGRRPDYRDVRPDYRDARPDMRRDDERYSGRYDDRRDPCLGLPGYDPRYDRCSR